MDSTTYLPRWISREGPKSNRPAEQVAASSNRAGWWQHASATHISPLRALVSPTNFSTDGALVPQRLSTRRRYTLASRAREFSSLGKSERLSSTAARLPRRKSTLAAINEVSRLIFRCRRRAIIDTLCGGLESHSPKPRSASTRCMTSRLISPAISFRTWAPSTRSASESPRRLC